MGFRTARLTCLCRGRARTHMPQPPPPPPPVVTGQREKHQSARTRERYKSKVFAPESENERMRARVSIPRARPHPVFMTIERISVISLSSTRNMQASPRPPPPKHICGAFVSAPFITRLNSNAFEIIARAGLPLLLPLLPRRTNCVRYPPSLRTHDESETHKFARARARLISLQVSPRARSRTVQSF